MTKQVKLLGITQLCRKTGCTVIDLTSCSVSGGQNSGTTNRAELKRTHCWLASFIFFSREYNFKLLLNDIKIELLVDKDEATQVFGRTKV